MKRTPKYVGLDVHQATTVSAVLGETGRVVARQVVPTEAPAILGLFRGMRGTIHVALEEGTQAQWLHDLLSPVVAEVIVCDRRGNHETRDRGNAAQANFTHPLKRETGGESPPSCLWENGRDERSPARAACGVSRASPE